MFAIRNLIRNTPQVSKNVIQLRNMSAVSTPARNKISKGETFFLASLMVVCWSAIPAWVLVHMKEYRDRS